MNVLNQAVQRAARNRAQEGNKVTELDDVEPDTIMPLTEDLQRLFRFAGCNPACHACEKGIEVGAEFQLATYTAEPYPGTSATVTKDVMLCATCTIVDLAEKERRRDQEVWRTLQRRGYSRPSRVST